MKDTVLNKIAEITGYDKAELFFQETFAVNGLDAEGLLELIMYIEDQYGIDLTDSFDPGDANSMTIEEFTDTVKQDVEEAKKLW